ncbi:type II CRISPR RNA-guided endonuclease Cas9 [Xanthobacter sp. VNH20]|uniref:type II CRISPR RNA-guided endonuclease Cas9 n=1 Tax=Xanthobacter sp. VNH20 TaxID=3156616 RepID=UPI0032B47D4C
MNWRLSLDLGAGSIGWCALELDENGAPIAVLAAGVRLFGDGRAPSRGDQQGTPLAVERRTARAMRRRRDRFKQRQSALLKHLELDGLFPVEAEARLALEGLDPFALRARALDVPLTLHEIGRALFHIDQRRGFKSNRKTDRGAEDDAGKIAVGIDRLCTAMDEAGARTFGEFLHMRRASATDPNAIPSVRTRLRPEAGENARGDGYDFYPGRELLQEEFDAIWQAQAPYHPGVLTSRMHDRLFEIIFHQRPLKRPKVGTCTLVPGEDRLPKAHPLFQRRRLLEEVNALMVVRAGEKAQPLALDQRNTLLLKLKDKAKVSFESLRKSLKLDSDARFNKESEHRGDLKGDEVAALLGHKSRFGTRWQHLAPDAQWEVIARVQEEEDETALTAWLENAWQLTPEQAKAVAGVRLPQGYGRFGRTATTRLIAALESEVITYDKAVAKAGLGHHSDFRTGEVFTDKKGNAALPYYGVVLEQHIMPGTAEPSDPVEMRIGRLTNPTVHIGLNQLRRLVNVLIRRFGAPEGIVIELARELKLTDDEKQRRSRENTKNRRDAEERSKKLAALGQADTGANRARLKLWEELNRDNVLDRRCVYTGAQISIDMLFSDKVEVDHILPFGATLDDSNANRILCLREANREKRKRSPFAAWGHTDRWVQIAELASRLPREKRWRFEPDAMTKFEGEGFIARHLVDTQYLSRMARQYLSALYPGTGEGSGRVWVATGRLTELVRRKLGLNSLLPDHNFGGGADQPKNRLDHRHHAIDAAVIGILDRGMLQRMARVSGEEGEEGRERVVVPDPWPTFRDDLKAAVNAIMVSHRPDHGTTSKVGLPSGRDQTAGRLHNDTAYGLVKDGRPDEVVHRVPLGGLKPAELEADDASGKRRVRDPDLRAALRDFTQGREGKDFERRLAQFSELGPLQFRNIRRVRVIEPLSVIPIRDREGSAYKGYKGDSNYRCDVWEMPDGKWVPEVISMFEAHQPGWTSRVKAGCPTARKVLRLHKDDILAVETAGERRLMKVLQLWQNGQVTLVPPNEGGDLRTRSKNADDPFEYTSPTAGGLKKLKARQVRVDEAGRVFDPGFPARKPAASLRPAD